MNLRVFSAIKTIPPNRNFSSIIVFRDVQYMSRQDIDFMRIALVEAQKGQGRTSPNPSVGAVIVRDGSVVGRGYHRKAGTPHAEVNAITDAGAAASGATIYVTLEPCNHMGRTPPCTSAIEKAGLARVVVGMRDPNPQVAGGGCSYLRSIGLQVEEGVLEDECQALNRPFVKYSRTGLPWIVLKAGVSLDGRISYRTGQGGRITGEESGRKTHQLRNTLDAILVGVDTALIDDPSLTTRLPEDIDFRDPLRIVLDSRLRLKPSARMLRNRASTLVFCRNDVPVKREDALTAAGAEVCRVSAGADGHLELPAILLELGKREITSVLVEGGAAIHGSFLRAGLVDEVYLFMAPVFIGDQGTPLIAGYSAATLAQTVSLDTIETEHLGRDIVIHGFVRPQV